MKSACVSTSQKTTLREIISVPHSTRQLWIETSTAQRQVAQTFDEFGSQTIMANEESHVDGTVERVEKQIHVHIFPQLAASDPAAERGVSLLAAWLQETFAESCDQVAVALSGAQHSGDDASTPAAQDLYQLTHLLTHVSADRTGIGEVQFARGTAGERVCDKSGLIWPPAVNRRLANAGMGGNSFDGQFREAFLRQQF